MDSHDIPFVGRIHQSAMNPGYITLDGRACLYEKPGPLQRAVAEHLNGEGFYVFQDQAGLDDAIWCVIPSCSSPAEVLESAAAKRKRFEEIYAQAQEAQAMFRIVQNAATLRKENLEDKRF